MIHAYICLYVVVSYVFMCLVVRRMIRDEKLDECDKANVLAFYLLSPVLFPFVAVVGAAYLIGLAAKAVLGIRS